MTSPEDHPNNPFERIRIGTNTCFLCGEPSSTDEHIIPKWLLKRQNLWDQRMTLLNGTDIPYRKLKVPSCNRCNNEYLGQLESTVRDAVNAGYEACRALEPRVLYQWLAKLFFGLLRKEASLLANRRSPSDGPIVPKEFIESFSLLHACLQSVRQPMSFAASNHFSVLVVNVHDLGEPLNYHFRDDIHNLVASIRTGEVGLIVAFQDAGVCDATYGRYLDEVDGRKLHPMQFDELFAKILYQCHRIDRTPKFLVAIPTADNGAQETSVTMLPLAGLSRKPVLKEWVQADFVEILAVVMSDWLEMQGIDRSALYEPPDRVMTWLTDAEGELWLQDPHGNRQ